jgi:hypothetical protein
MKIALAPLILAASATLAACGGSPSPAPSPSHASLPSPAALVYDNSQACAAFREATTTGVPAADAGEDTQTWLASQESGATPALLAQFQDFAAAWAATPPDVGAINQATRKIGQICAGGQG